MQPKNPSESLPALPPRSHQGSTPGVGGDPTVILLVTFVDLVKKIVTNVRMHEQMDRQT